jgi:hypothetical protein
MTTAAPAVESTGSDERPRLLAVEIGDWAGLDGKVRLELDATRTVLVGKNGVGKSVLVEGVSRAARLAISPPSLSSQPAPRSFRCDIARPNASPIVYEYRIGPDDAEEELDVSGTEGIPRRRVRPWYERCWVRDGDELWKVENSKLIVRGGEAVPFSPGLGLLAVEDTPDDLLDETDEVARLLVGVVLIPAGVPRSEIAYRREVIARSIRRGGVAPRRWMAPRPYGRVEALAYWIASTWEHRRDLYEEFVTILRDLDLVQDVNVKIYEDPQAEQNPEERRDFASVLFDGVNIGLQSDGTLRVAEIVARLLWRGISCLLVEEPETAVHPGLLSKLLALMYSYSFDRQIVVSTHSPQVVNWCEPGQLRLVERERGSTKVHSLGSDDIDRVMQYLHDQGTLADFVYARESE